MRYITVLAVVLVLATSVSAQDSSASMEEEAAARGIGGIGLSACESVIGAANAPLLAQAADWMLGYMAGRIDAGETLVEGEPLSAASSVDLITSIASFCSANPDATILAAARRYGQRVFGTLPTERSFEDAPEEARRPEPRPAIDVNGAESDG